VCFEQVGAFPKPKQKPHPPIVIGGKGRRALRRASLHGDGYHGMSSTPAELAQEVEVLREIATRDQRDPGEIEILLSQSVSIYESPLEGERAPLHGSIEQVGDDLLAYEEAGLQHLVGTPMRVGAGESPLEQARAGLETFASQILPGFQSRSGP
jgi:alkanesulfonate monooxygenase SsuD/methylene tetrahydromethanopterin reductase-like flavin-dependent oxidoreductase (luciferase family)